MAVLQIDSMARQRAPHCGDLDFTSDIQIIDYTSYLLVEIDVGPEETINERWYTLRRAALKYNKMGCKKLRAPGNGSQY